jgi:transcription antitermination factor NusG
MDNANTNWYVFYTRPRSEKVVCNELLKRHYYAFLPQVRTLNRWKNRQNKMISRVLFPGYIFVKTSTPEILIIEQIPKIVYCVRCGHRPAVVPEKDIECIEHMLNLDQDVFTDHDFEEGEHARVVKGPLSGYEGILTHRRGKTRFCIQLKDIKQCACIYIQTSVLEKT